MNTARRRAASTGTVNRRSVAASALASCAQAEQLWAYLDGELPAPGARAIARHLAACEVCGRRARRLRTMLETCRAAGCRRLPADVRARAKKRIAALLVAHLQNGEVEAVQHDKTSVLRGQVQKRHQ